MTVAVRPPLRRAQSTLANHDGVLIVVALGFLIRVGVAFWNAYFGPSYGAEGDALEFHLRAVELVQQGDLGEFALGWVYAQYLAMVYGLTGESLLIGSLLSCLAWLASAALLIGMARALGLGWRATFTAALIYAVMPTSILHTGVTLREAYQLLFVNLACWSGLRILARDSAANWLLLVVGCLGMAVLHGALAGFAGALLASLILIRRHRVQSRLHSRGRRPSLSVAVLVLGLVVWALSMLFPALQGELMMSLIQSQQGYIGSEARAQYRTEFDIDGIAAVITFVPGAIAQYLFEPFPWRALNAVDLGLLLENAIRALLIFHIVRDIRRVPAPMKHGVALLAVAYALLEAIWAPGTVNWGTAARHHIPSIAVLLICGLACRQARVQERRRTTGRRLQNNGLSVPCPKS